MAKTDGAIGKRLDPAAESVTVEIRLLDAPQFDDREVNPVPNFEWRPRNDKLVVALRVGLPDQSKIGSHFDVVPHPFIGDDGLHPDGVELSPAHRIAVQRIIPDVLRISQEFALCMAIGQREIPLQTGLGRKRRQVVLKCAEITGISLDAEKC